MQTSAPRVGHRAEPRAGRPEASAAIWPWRESRTQPEPSPARARIHGLLQAAIGAGAAALLYHLASTTLGVVVFCVATAIGLAALGSPNGLYRAIQGAFASLGRLTGRVLTWLMLVPLFYLFFLPFGLLLRRGRRDRMQRFFDSDANSYWEPHKAFAPADHERQF